jgi:hypothetical protein
MEILDKIINVTPLARKRPSKVYFSKRREIFSNWLTISPTRLVNTLSNWFIITWSTRNRKDFFDQALAQKTGRSIVNVPLVKDILRDLNQAM